MTRRPRAESWETTLKDGICVRRIMRDTDIIHNDIRYIQGWSVLVGKN